MSKKSVGKGTKLYKCGACGEEWLGVTNRVASRPLNKKAVDFANREVYKDCKKLANHRRITMQDSDYLCRRRWMDSYLSYVEPAGTDGPKRKPSEPFVPCPPEPAIPAEVKCAVLEAYGRCEHVDSKAGARVARHGMVLEVVPGSSVGTDKIQLDAQMQKPCGSHPQWNISRIGIKNGVKQSFGAKGPISGKLWMPTIVPDKYLITCAACNGPTQSLEIHTYAPNEISLDIEPKEMMKTALEALKIIEKVVDVVAGRWKWKFFEGKASINACWKEHTDWRAFFKYKISAGFDPLFGLRFRIEVGPNKATKWIEKMIPVVGKWIKKTVDFVIKLVLYFEGSGGINLDIKWERTSPDEPKYVLNRGAGVAGKIGLKLGGEGSVLGTEKRRLLKLEPAASGSITAGGEPFLEEKGCGLKDFKVEFDGLKGTLTLVFVWGIKFEPSIVLVGPQTIYGPKTVWLHKEK